MGNFLEEEKRGRHKRKDKEKKGDVREYVTLGKKRKQMRQNCENDGSNSPGRGTRKKKKDKILPEVFGSNEVRSKSGTADVDRDTDHSGNM